jgi:ketosteroid isomerase-like protein
MTTEDLALAVRTYFDALNSHDLDAITATFTRDASVMGPGEPTATGSAQVRDLYHGTLERLAFGRIVHIDELEQQGALGVVRCHTTGSLTLRAEDKTIEAVSRELFGLVNLDGEGWKIKYYMFNQPVAIPSH